MLQTSQAKQRSGLCLSPPGRGHSAMQLPRCRGRWAPLPWQASHSGSHTPAQLTAIYHSLPRQKPPSTPGAVGCGGHESQNTGEGDGAPWDESSNQVSMRQTRWPGFKANFCNRGRRGGLSTARGALALCRTPGAQGSEETSSSSWIYNSVLGISVQSLQQSIAWFLPLSPDCEQIPFVLRKPNLGCATGKAGWGKGHRPQLR